MQPRREDRPRFPTKKEILTAIAETTQDEPYVYIKPYTILRCSKGSTQPDEFFIYLSNESGMPLPQYEDFLGSGSSSMVTKGYRINSDTGEPSLQDVVALKCIRDIEMKEVVATSADGKKSRDYVKKEEVFKTAEMEAEFLKKFSHRANLVRLEYFVVLITDCYSVPQLGEFNKYNFELDPRLKALSFPKKIELICQLADLLTHFHSQGCAHLDFVASNIKFNLNEQTQELNVFVVDFGSMRQFKDDKLIPAIEIPFGEEIMGTPFQRAPELHEKMMGIKSDIPPFLLLIICILNGDSPLKNKKYTTGKNNFFDGRSDVDVLDGYCIDAICQNCHNMPHPYVIEFITAFARKMQNEYAERPSIQEVKQFFGTVSQLCNDIQLHEKDQKSVPFDFKDYFVKLVLLAHSGQLGEYKMPTESVIQEAIISLQMAGASNTEVFKILLQGNQQSLDLAQKICLKIPAKDAFDKEATGGVRVAGMSIFTQAGPKNRVSSPSSTFVSLNQDAFDPETSSAPPSMSPTSAQSLSSFSQDATARSPSSPTSPKDGKAFARDQPAAEGTVGKPGAKNKNK